MYLEYEWDSTCGDMFVYKLIEIKGSTFIILCLWTNENNRRERWFPGIDWNRDSENVIIIYSVSNVHSCPPAGDKRKHRLCIDDYDGAFSWAPISLCNKRKSARIQFRVFWFMLRRCGGPRHDGQITTNFQKKKQFAHQILFSISTINLCNFRFPWNICFSYGSCLEQEHFRCCSPFACELPCSDDDDMKN